MKARELTISPLPDPPRPGLHVSDLIQMLLKAKDPGRYGNEPDEAVKRKWELGLAWEHYALTELVPKRMGRSFRLEHQVPASYQGVVGTVDAIDRSQRIVVECKLTEIKSQDILSDKFWSWRVQGMAYCQMHGYFTVIYPVCFLRGDYTDSCRMDFRIFELKFSRAEINRNWRMLMNAKADMEEEQA